MKTKKTERVIRWMLAIIAAFLGGYVFQCAIVSLLTKVIFGEIKYDLMQPRIESLVLVAWVLYFNMLLFKIVDKKKWWQITTLAALVISALILVFFACVGVFKF